MSNNFELPYFFQWSNTHAHIAWADIHGNGLKTEIAVVSIDRRSGDLYFIPIENLDQIDRSRLLQIINRRDAVNYSLWDLMDSTTLKNGANALEYFHQLVQVRSVSGQIFKPMAGRMGIQAVGGKSITPPVATQQVVQKNNAVAPKKTGKAPPKID